MNGTRVVLLIAAVLVLAGCSSHEAPASPQPAVFSHDLKAHSKTVREAAEGNTRKALEDARSRSHHRLSGPGQRGAGHSSPADDIAAGEPDGESLLVHLHSKEIAT